MSNTSETFSVTLINEAKGLNKTIQVAKNEYILDVAEEEDINMPYSCRTGSCFNCLGKVLEGQVEQTAQALNFLKRDEIEKGYILTCTASPTSDCIILTHQEEEFFS
jgi:ferredoxin